MSKQTDLINVTDAITVDGSNNVGIGTDSPQATAEISGGLDNRLRINSTDGTTSNDYGIDFSTAGVVRGGIRYNAGNNYLALYGYDNAERMRIDSSGRVTMPYQPAFVAYDPDGGIRSSTGLFSDEFTATLKNTGNHYNTSTGYFTAPIAGYYLFGWNLFSTVSGATASRAGMWYNGSTGGYGFSSGSTVAGAAQGSLLMYMSANDTAALGTQGAYTAYWYGDLQHNRFWGYLVG